MLGFFFFLIAPCSLQDLSSLTRDWDQALAVKASNPNDWTSMYYFKLTRESLSSNKGNYDICFHCYYWLGFMILFFFSWFIPLAFGCLMYEPFSLPFHYSLVFHHFPIFSIAFRWSHLLLEKRYISLIFIFRQDVIFLYLLSLRKTVQVRTSQTLAWIRII